MPVNGLHTTRSFEKQFHDLPPNIKKMAEEKEEIFRNDPFDPRLNTHKLHGKDHGSWAFSVTHSYRIKFLFLPSDGVLFLAVGMHDIYK